MQIWKKPESFSTKFDLSSDEGRNERYTIIRQSHSANLIFYCLLSGFNISAPALPGYPVGINVVKSIFF
jgi:hypothetical protein